MNELRNGIALAARDHLVAGQPITRLEAIVLYGVSDLPSVVKDMRRQGWIVKSRLVPYAAAAVRINQHAVLQPPPNLPIREIQLTEYQISK